jgi:uncharacterized Zn-finger protein
MATESTDVIRENSVAIYHDWDLSKRHSVQLRFFTESCVPNPDTAATARENRLIEPNAENEYRVSRADLPLHCPMDGMSLWNSHPRVYLAI